MQTMLQDMIREKMKKTFESKYKDSLNNIKKQQELLEAAKGGAKKKGAMEMLKEQEKEKKKQNNTSGGGTSDIKMADIENLFKSLNESITKVSSE